MDNGTKQRQPSRGSSQEKHEKNITSLAFGKIPPQDIPMEEAVLGAALLERDKQDELFDIINDHEVFYKDAHQIVFMAMHSLYNRGEAIDLITLTDHLRKSGFLDSVGGAYELTKLTMSVVSSAHLEIHARLILEKYMGRELIRVGGAMVNSGYDESTDVFEALDYAEDKLDKLKNKIITKPYSHVSKGVMESRERIAELKEKNMQFTGITTGFRPLDNLTSGWQKPDLIVVAARPGVGKTAFTLNAAIKCAASKTYGGPVGIFNLEMNHSQLINRMVACISGVKLKHISNPSLMSAAEAIEMEKGFDNLAALKIYIDDTAGLTLNELRSKARKMKRKEGIVLLIVDYLQLMQVDGFTGNREQEISKISRGLKKLAKELEIPIIALSQMNRDVDKEDRAPELADLRESGAIEQDADIVMFLWRPSPKRIKARPELAGKILGMVKKHRNGECDEVLFHVDNSIQRWLDEEPTIYSGTFIPDQSLENLPF